MREAVTNYPFTPAHVKRFLWGATDVTTENIFAPIWQSMDIEDQTVYQIG
jgi:hypothetical protein